jgi:hypothetical protein
MSKISDMADYLLSQQDQHLHSLDQAQQSMAQVLDTLDHVSASTANIGITLGQAANLGGWWPHILCPAVSLVMGSYRMPPSAFRNILLVGIGQKETLSLFLVLY